MNLESRQKIEQYRINRCPYYYECPSCSGWCNNKHPNARCVPYLISAYEYERNKFNILMQRMEEIRREHIIL